jgi:DNA-binding transcriptional LysR family regulator
VAVGVLPKLIGIWHELYPNVAIRLHEYVHRSLLEEAVEQGVADFALGPMPVRKWDGPLELVGWEEFVLVVPRRHSLARRKRVRLEELIDLQWVLYHPDHGLAGIVEELCRNAGFTPRGTVRTSQAEGAVRLAAAGLGIALVRVCARSAFSDRDRVRRRGPLGRTAAPGGSSVDPSLDCAACAAP